MNDQEDKTRFTSLETADTTTPPQEWAKKGPGRPKKKAPREQIARTQGFSLYPDEFAAIRKLRQRIEILTDRDVSKTMALRAMIRYFEHNAPDDRVLSEIHKDLCSSDLRISQKIS